MSQRLLPGVPLIESPLFATEIAQADLSEQERDLAIALNRDGFAVLDFPDPELEARIARMTARLAPQFADTGRSADGVVYHAGRIQDAWRNDEDVAAIANNPQVLALLSKLYQRQAFPFQTLNFRQGTQQALHTDAVHFSSVPPRFMCGVWLALEDIAADAGPLHYIAGSHRWPMLDNAMLGRRGFGGDLGSAQAPYQQVWDTMIAQQDVKPQVLLARKGQALIWCANLLHGGSPQNDPSLTRWSQVTHYFFEDCVYYTPAFSDEYLGRLHLRELVSTTDRKPRPNRYLGEEIRPPAPALAKATRSGAKRWAKQVGRWLG